MLILSKKCRSAVYEKVFEKSGMKKMSLETIAEEEEQEQEQQEEEEELS